MYETSSPVRIPIPASFLNMDEIAKLDIDIPSNRVFNDGSVGVDNEDYYDHMDYDDDEVYYGDQFEGGEEEEEEEQCDCDFCKDPKIYNFHGERYINPINKPESMSGWTFTEFNSTVRSMTNVDHKAVLEVYKPMYALVKEKTFALFDVFKFYCDSEGEWDAVFRCIDIIEEVYAHLENLTIRILFPHLYDHDINNLRGTWIQGIFHPFKLVDKDGNARPLGLCMSDDHKDNIETTENESALTTAPITLDTATKVDDVPTSSISTTASIQVDEADTPVDNQLPTPSYPTSPPPNDMLTSSTELYKVVDSTSIDTPFMDGKGQQEKKEGNLEELGTPLSTPVATTTRGLMELCLKLFEKHEKAIQEMKLDVED